MRICWLSLSLGAASDNAHVLEQFYGMDTLTASQLAALERAVEAGEDAQADGGDAAAVKAAIEAESEW